MNNHTNLMIWTLLKMGIVGKIEKTLQSWYDYFSHGLKRIEEFLELVDIQKTSGGGHIISNIKTKWVLMLVLTKWILSEYHTLIFKMSKMQAQTCYHRWLVTIYGYKLSPYIINSKCKGFSIQCNLKFQLSNLGLPGMWIYPSPFIILVFGI